MVAINRSERKSSQMFSFARGSSQESGRGVKKWVNAPASFRIPLVGRPTEAPPGTIEKLLVMIARERRGEELFHKWDAKIDGCFRPLMFYIAEHEQREETRTNSDKVGT